MENKTTLIWCKKRLSGILGYEVDEEYCKSLLEIESKDDLTAIFDGMIDLSVPSNKEFITELFDRKLKSLNHEETDFKIYRKTNLLEDVGSQKTKKSKEKENKLFNTIDEKSINDVQKNIKQKKHFFDNQINSEIIIPGRHKCECQASKHKLICNCLKCGKIICEQEGSGPCLFCGNLVCTKEELQKINSGSKKGEKLKSELLSKQSPQFMNSNEELQKAIEHKNKLIEFDRNSTKRTQVIDDESDYFQSNNMWLSKEQKQELKKKEKEIKEIKYGSKLKAQKYTLDLSNNKLLQQNDTINYDEISKYNEKILNESSHRKISNVQNLIDDESFHNNDGILNPEISLNSLKYITSENDRINKFENDTLKNQQKTRNLRIQDKELQEMNDNGLALSMHQPWASLLIHGIKRHEGRKWCTNHRGRLWIHAASKQPTVEDIESTEQFYRCYYNNPEIEFPSYPTGCLLGYVDLFDCLDTDNYKKRFPNGESTSPYVFICENFCELLVKFPMVGDHKIFKLERGIFQAARKTAIIQRK